MVVRVRCPVLRVRRSVILGPVEAPEQRSPNAVGRTPVSGRLDTTVPARGERFVDLAAFGGLRVEHIVSSDTPDPGPQVRDWDEWVLVVAGSAHLEVAGVECSLAGGDWILLPAGTPHRVLRTASGTQWIAVHGPAPLA